LGLHGKAQVRGPVQFGATTRLSRSSRICPRPTATRRQSQRGRPSRLGRPTRSAVELFESARSRRDNALHERIGTLAKTRLGAVLWADAGSYSGRRKVSSNTSRGPSRCGRDTCSRSTRTCPCTPWPRTRRLQSRTRARSPPCSSLGPTRVPVDPVLEAGVQMRVLDVPVDIVVQVGQRGALDHRCGRPPNLRWKLNEQVTPLSAACHFMRSVRP